MTKHVIGAEVLAQHTAIVGKTRSGKTSTSKLALEQVVADEFRVCVLDTVKSDWWGLISSATGGGFSNALSSLRSKGWAAGHGSLAITDEGLESLGGYDPLPCGRALLEHWYGQLSKAERSALEVLAKAYPSALSKEEVAAACGYEASGGGFNNALSRLRTLELITGRGELKASDDLFSEAA